MDLPFRIEQSAGGTQLDNNVNRTSFLVNLFSFASDGKPINADGGSSNRSSELEVVANF
jgi:hypothetical protein